MSLQEGYPSHASHSWFARENPSGSMGRPAYGLGSRVATFVCPWDYVESCWDPSASICSVLNSISDANSYADSHAYSYTLGYPNGCFVLSPRLLERPLARTTGPAVGFVNRGVGLDTRRHRRYGIRSDSGPALHRRRKAYRRCVHRLAELGAGRRSRRRGRSLPLDEQYWECEGCIVSRLPRLGTGWHRRDRGQGD